jgi:hypothetical protein
MLNVQMVALVGMIKPVVKLQMVSMDVVLMKMRCAVQIMNTVVQVDDHVHCCPSGYTCDVEQGMCTEGTVVTTKLQPHKVSVKVVPCPNGGNCDDGETCCEISSDPCSEGTVVTTKLQPISSKVSVKDVECPDGGTCGDDQTCCETSNGEYGCCPYENAVCCSDHEHCCPSG